MRAVGRTLLVALILIGVSLQPQGALAWGQYGHLTICDLAYRNLTDPAKAALKALFHAPEGITVKAQNGTERSHYTSFNVGCLEEDLAPRPHPDDHFINVSRDVSAITRDTCPGQASCVLEGIARDLAVLSDTKRSDEDRVYALMAVGHWVGDVHQPLHISFADDHGGNRILVKPSARCGTATYRADNLHAVWDNCILEAGLFQRVRERADYKPSWGKRTITYRAVDTLLANTKLTEEKKIVAGEPWQWAQESFAITLRPDVVYCVMVAGTCQYDESRVILTSENEADFRHVQIGPDYLRTFDRLAEERVRLAGFRLAHLINQALDPNYIEPIQNSTQSP